jgi:hypothetical protein
MLGLESQVGVVQWFWMPGSAGQQLIEAALSLEREQIVATTDMDIANEDLRYGVATVTARHHLLAQYRLKIDPDLLISRAFLFK